MAATALPNIGNKAGYSAGDNGWVDDYNYLNRAVDSLVQCTIAAILAAPPGTRTAGKLYIAATSATGAWAGWDGRIIRDNVSSWESYVPKEGWYIYNQADATAYRYKSGAWVVDNFLPKSNPTFTGTLTGPTISATGAITAAARSQMNGYVGQPTIAWFGCAGLNTGVAATHAGLYARNDGEMGIDAAPGKPISLSIGATAKLRVTESAMNLGSAVELQQNGTTRITAGGHGRFVGLRASEVAGTGTRPLVALSDGTVDDQDASAFRGTIGAAPAPSRATISASTSLGGISASAIYIPTTDVNLTLDGGVDGQAWDIYSAASVGLIVPSGTSLYAYNGIDTGPTTRPVGGGRAIRVVRLTATTWLVPNMSW